jgi:hypothetical protein
MVSQLSAQADDTYTRLSRSFKATVLQTSGKAEHLTDETDDTTFFYTQNFEPGMGSWNTQDMTDVGLKWHIDDFLGYQGSNSWWCADTLINGYGNFWLQYLVSPSINLAGTANPTLTAKVRYAVQDTAEAASSSGGAYDGWDGCNAWVSNDGGINWQILTPNWPAYTCQSLYSFGETWAMGDSIPGWAGESGPWLNTQFSLSHVAGNSDVKIRFAFCSNRRVSTLGDISLWGFFVDEISIDEGPVNYLYNNADDPPYPAEFTFASGPPSGDYWALTTSSSHSPTHSMRCDHAGHYRLSDALVSSWINIPDSDSLLTRMQFWLWCDMPDWNGDADNKLDDFYMVEVTTDEILWKNFFVDHGGPGRPGAAGTGWELYKPGMPYNGEIQMDLSDYGGQQIKLRWRVVTDDNDDGGVGTGLHVDDIRLYTFDREVDVGAERLHVPMPVTVYLDQIQCSMEMHNYGSVNQQSVEAYLVVDSIPEFLPPAVSIPAGGMVLKQWAWDLPGVGSYEIEGFVQIAQTDSTKKGNDTQSIGTVESTEEDTAKFGYDSRPDNLHIELTYFEFGQNDGAWVRFTPSDDGIDANMNGEYLQTLFYTPGPVRVHIYEAGTATQPGPEIADFVSLITTVYPDWATIDISTVGYLQYSNTDFWVWYETIEEDGHPMILGHEQVFGAGHYFTGSEMNPIASDYDFFARAVMSILPDYPDATVTLTPLGMPIVIPAHGGFLEFNIAVANNEPAVQPITVWTDVTLPNGSAYGPIIGPITVDVQPGDTLDRNKTQNVPDTAPWGDYTYHAYIGEYPATVWHEDSFDFVKLEFGTDGFLVDNWDCTGESFYIEAREMPTLECRLGRNYPNPFNPSTVFSYQLSVVSHVNLAVYDIAGRQIVELVNGWRDAGRHHATFDGSSLASGIYFYRLQAEDFISVKKMVLLK